MAGGGTGWALRPFPPKPFHDLHVSLDQPHQGEPSTKGSFPFSAPSLYKEPVEDSVGQPRLGFWEISDQNQVCKTTRAHLSSCSPPFTQEGCDLPLQNGFRVLIRTPEGSESPRNSQHCLYVQHPGDSQSLLLGNLLGVLLPGTPDMGNQEGLWEVKWMRMDREALEIFSAGLPG